MADKGYTVDKYGNPIPPEPLKPCPFCGAEASFIVGLSLFHVKCSKCNMGLHGTHSGPLVRAWNKRVKVQVPKQERRPKK